MTLIFSQHFHVAHKPISNPKEYNFHSTLLPACGRDSYLIHIHSPLPFHSQYPNFIWGSNGPFPLLLELASETCRCHRVEASGETLWRERTDLTGRTAPSLSPCLTDIIAGVLPSTLWLLSHGIHLLRTPKYTEEDWFLPWWLYTRTSLLSLDRHLLQEKINP